MKILHIVSSTSQSNGVMNVIMNYYKEMIKYDIQFDFLYFENSQLNYDSEIKKNGGKCICCYENSPYDTIKKIYKYIKLHGNDYNAIEIHELYLTKILPKTEAKIILHSHTTKYSQRILSSIRNKILCYKLEKYGDYYFSCSQKSANVFWPKIINTSKYKIVKNAIPLQKCKFSSSNRKKIRKQMNIKNDEILLGYVARFDKGKNHQFLVKLMNYIKQKSNKYKLMFIGSGKTEKQIRKMVNQYNLNEFVIFCGQVASSEIKSYLSAMDLFLFPSKNEGLGQVAIEAQANGLKCIVSTEIPLEAKISDNYVSIPLINLKTKKENIENWYKEIEKETTGRNKINFKKSGYDIEVEAKKLADLYKKM